MKTAEVTTLLRAALRGDENAASALRRARIAQHSDPVTRALENAWKTLARVAPAVAVAAERRWATPPAPVAPVDTYELLRTGRYREWLEAVSYSEWLAENDGFDGELSQFECRDRYENRIADYEKRQAYLAGRA